MKYNPDIYKRKSIRLKGYDYSQSGMYFITICTYNSEKIFGRIMNGSAGSSCTEPTMRINKVGNIIVNEINALKNKYNSIVIDEFVIMPNHIHFILELKNTQTGQENPAPTIGNIIGYFKFITTKKYNEILGIKTEKYAKLWQRNYYDNIIRNEETYIKVSNYIETNPLKWKEDKYFD